MICVTDAPDTMRKIRPARSGVAPLRSRGNTGTVCEEISSADHYRRFFNSRFDNDYQLQY